MSNDYWISAVATDYAAGNALAGLIGPESGDATSFDRGRLCYPAGTTFTESGELPFVTVTPSNPESARYVGVAAKQAAYDLAAEYVGAGPYPLLNALGVTDQQVAWFKQRVFVVTGPRAIESDWRAHIESFGFATR
jgi:hypothetical protein